MYFVLNCFYSHTKIHSIYLSIYLSFFLSFFCLSFSLSSFTFVGTVGVNTKACGYHASITPFETLSKLQSFILVINYIITFSLYIRYQVFFKYMVIS
jgi:hypothetical protein